MANVAGVRFKKACKIYNFDAGTLVLRAGDRVIVEVEKGIGLGRVVAEPTETDEAALERKLKKVVRKADEVDIERLDFNREREDEAYATCKEMIKKFELLMKLVRVEYMFDSSKAIFYFTSDTRVDFRELVKELAGNLYTRIEMRQIGVRDEAKITGGIGPCGRELCCSEFLMDFEPVTVKMAKQQNVALNPLKISGVCGRLMCCISYEYEGGPGGKGGGKGGKGGKGGHSGHHGKGGGHHGKGGGDDCGGCPDNKGSNGNKGSKGDKGSNGSNGSKDSKGGGDGAKVEAKHVKN